MREILTILEQNQKLSQKHAQGSQGAPKDKEEDLSAKATAGSPSESASSIIETDSSKKAASEGKISTSSNQNPHHTKSLLETPHKLLTYVLSKLSISELQMIRGEQLGIADMLEDNDVGFYTKD